jgi:hypothetical protein
MFLPQLFAPLTRRQTPASGRTVAVRPAPLIITVVLLLAASMHPWTPASAQSPAQSPGQPPAEYRTVDLRTQLITGLRVVQPSQAAYVDRVVRTVQQGKMSEAMVQLIYRWSIERNPRVPFPYFQLAMQALTQRRGIVLLE